MYRPSFTQSRIDQTSREVQVSVPLSECHSLSIERNPNILASIILLLNSISPHAVGGFVISVIIFAFNRMSFRRLAHIFVEVFKFQPTVTYRNTSATIFRIVKVGLQRATLNDATPDAVDFGMCHSVSASTGTEVFPRTPATLLQTCCEATGTNFHTLSTSSAFNPPFHIFTFSTSVSKDEQIFRMFARHIGRSGFGWKRNYFNVIFGIGHLANSLLVRNLTRLADLFTQDCEPFFNYTIVETI